ncbi:hypothetical protein HDU78_001013 [Chytriomyces hyalinus]|nr:hypothetical protein HDU78_001013 [Chytriomyces hyalinus]
MREYTPEPDISLGLTDLDTDEKNSADDPLTVTGLASDEPGGRDCKLVEVGEVGEVSLELGCERDAEEYWTVGDTWDNDIRTCDNREAEVDESEGGNWEVTTSTDEVIGGSEAAEEIPDGDWDAVVCEGGWDDAGLTGDSVDDAAVVGSETLELLDSE